MPNSDEIRYASVLLTGQQKTFIKTLLGLYKKRAKRQWVLQSHIQHAHVVFIGEQRDGADVQTFEDNVTSDHMII